ncbi:hypothetical protein CBF31_07400 [Vagococcus fessus]|uniref:Uncharacterized protein n=1 Tax=Vagococcus fessus TaxID=120370 RepID=A0A430A8Y9_9ENTE|nr:hypothetical protein CBF31_07400 [Vagococcus fessus]
MDIRIEKTMKSIWLAVLVWGVVTLVLPYLFFGFQRVIFFNLLLDPNLWESGILIVLASYNLKIWK